MKAEERVSLTKMDVLRLITRDGLFWHGCPCEACESTRVKIASAWPDLASTLVGDYSGRKAYEHVG